MENINSIISFTFGMLAIVCLAYFLIKGNIGEGWSGFALMWVVLFIFCLVLLEFPPYGRITPVYWVCFAVYFGAMFDYFDSKISYETRLLLQGGLSSGCLGLLFIN